MRKALGLLAWTSLAASGLWATLPGGTTRPVSADQPASTTTVVDRGSSLSRINPFSRSRSNKTPTNKESDAANREQAEKLLKEAQALALRGDLAGARQLAERAQSFPVEWGPKDRSPDKFIALDASMIHRSPETAIAAKPNTSSSKKTSPTASGATNFDNAVAKAPKAEPTRTPIQQVANEEPIEEVTEETVEEPIAEEPAPSTKRPVGPTSAEKMASAKSLMQQARRDLAKGDIEGARDKAEQASEIDVDYTAFDQRPEQLLAEIDRRSNNVGEGAPHSKPRTGSEVRGTDFGAGLQ